MVVARALECINRHQGGGGEVVDLGLYFKISSSFSTLASLAHRNELLLLCLDTIHTFQFLTLGNPRAKPAPTPESRLSSAPTPGLNGNDLFTGLKERKNTWNWSSATLATTSSIYSTWWPRWRARLCCMGDVSRTSE